ncbi:MAG: hypothetical protein KGL35_08610 [Bradyrhizobium sp.]|nr:hypothetical protein [Bradyrhizobium sp.]
MNADNEEGDYALKGLVARGYDLMFAPDELSDSAISAASRAQARFHQPFPAWQAYRSIMNGNPADRAELMHYATGVGLAMLCRKPKRGRDPLQKKGVWMVDASTSAMVRCIDGSFPRAAVVAAADYAVDYRTYSKLRNELASQFIGAVNDFRGILHEQAERVLRFDAKM